ncbi:hypothetical protein QE435_000112 [Rhizobium sp. SORGH_AS 787]|nr:hypothetical protein [Rhizobium sp. SORGH_AS_0787]
MQFRHQAVERSSDTAALFAIALAHLHRDIDQPTDQSLLLNYPEPALLCLSSVPT